jgi:hypothetical protein
MHKFGWQAMAAGTGGVPEVWLKLTLQHAHTTLADYRSLLDLVATTAKRLGERTATDFQAV